MSGGHNATPLPGGGVRLGPAAGCRSRAGKVPHFRQCSWGSMESRSSDALRRRCCAPDPIPPRPPSSRKRRMSSPAGVSLCVLACRAMKRVVFDVRCRALGQRDTGLVDGVGSCGLWPPLVAELLMASRSPSRSLWRRRRVVRRRCWRCPDENRPIRARRRWRRGTVRGQPGERGSRQGRMRPRRSDRSIRTS
jgi:hypothetical protein